MRLRLDQAEAFAGAVGGAMTIEREQISLTDFASQWTVRLLNKPRQLDPRRHPAQWYMLQAIDGGLRRRTRFRRFIAVKPVQDGGTITTQSLVQLYVTGELGMPMVAGNPDMRLAGLQWRTKTKKLLQDSGRTSWLPEEGPGSEDAANPVQIQIRGRGELFFLGAGASNEAGQAMITGYCLTRDELDSMAKYMAELMVGRLEHYGRDAVIVDTSTIKDDEESPILQAHELSTAGHVRFACLYCIRFVMWQWKHVEADWSSASRAAATVLMRCPNCKRTFDDKQRLEMIHLENSRLVMKGQTVNDAGVVEGPEPDTNDWGLLWRAVDSPLTQLEDLAVKYQQAKAELLTGQDQKIRRFVRDRDSTTYVPDIGDKEISHGALARQSGRSTFHKRTVPSWARFMTLGQDVQGDRHYWLVMAFNDDCSLCAIVDWGFEYLVQQVDGQPVELPTEQHRHAVLLKIELECQSGWQIVGAEASDDGADRMSPVRRVVDMGWNKKEVFPWVEAHPQWVLVRGVGRDQAGKMDKTAMKEGKSILPKELAAALLGIIDVRQPDTMTRPLANVNGHEMRLALQTALMRKPGDPGSCLIPQGLKSNDYLCLHLSAEVWTEERDNKDVGTGKWFWRQVRKNQNHLLDCATYAYAIGLYHREALRYAAAQAAKRTSNAGTPARDANESEYVRNRRQHSRLR